MSFTEIIEIIYFTGIGLCLGSFVNAWVYRTRENKSLMERSICPNCLTQLKWYHNIPVFSYLFLKGKCHNCNVAIPFSYPLTELSTAILFGMGAYFNLDFGIFQGISGMVAMAALFLALSYATTYDFKYKEIPDQTYPLLLVPATYLFVKGGYDLWTFAAAFTWPVAFLIVDAAFKAYLRLKIRYGYLEPLSEGEELPDSVGGGDLKLAVFLGAMLPLSNVLPAFLFSYFVAFFFVIPYLAYLHFKGTDKAKLKNDEGDEYMGYSDIPFGPWMIASFLFVLFFGNPLFALGLVMF